MDLGIANLDADVARFVDALSGVQLPDVFNPYRDRCPVHDPAGAAHVRARNLASYLMAVRRMACETVWMGRDLGYRGGRRTGLAFTDEAHLSDLERLYPGAQVGKATQGEAWGERTAGVLWHALERVEPRPLLWNVLPLHPHVSRRPMSNRAVRAHERDAVHALNDALLRMMGVRQVVAIGNDAAAYAQRFGLKVCAVRHPSYGGIADFRAGIAAQYGVVLDVTQAARDRQGTLF